MKILSVTVQHDPAQDRILLIARDAVAEQVLLLTRRLTFGLIATLGKLIQQSQGNSRLADIGLQSELLSMKHAHALSQIREAQVDCAPPKPAPQRLPSRLLTQIDIRDDPSGRILVFFETASPIAQLALDARQLHWFVGRLATHSRIAGWGGPVPVPEWLDQTAATEFAAGQAKTHSVH